MKPAKPKALTGPDALTMCGSHDVLKTGPHDSVIALQRAGDGTITAKGGVCAAF